MRAVWFCCLTDNRVQNRPWGKGWGKVRSETGCSKPWMTARVPFSRDTDKALKCSARQDVRTWKVGPITEDVEMNMPDLFGRLKPLNDGMDRFREHISWAGKTRRAKVRVWRRPPRSG
jgi:hypothetical protein